MTIEELIQKIKERRERYLSQLNNARLRLKKEMDYMTSSQISSDMLHIHDLESRAYALLLLLEDIGLAE